MRPTACNADSRDGGPFQRRCHDGVALDGAVSVRRGAPRDKNVTREDVIRHASAVRTNVDQATARTARRVSSCPAPPTQL